MRIKYLILICVLAMTGCLPALQKSPSNHLINQSWRATDIQQEIVKREKRPSSDRKNVFILALLHTHPRNQQPDYQAAKKYLRRYLASRPPDHREAHSDWRPQHIYHLLETISTHEETIKTQKETQTTDQVDCQNKYTECRNNLKKVQGALKKSKRSASLAKKQLKKTQSLSTDLENQVNQLQIENIKLKKQIKKLTDLYIDLEKKRQAIQ